MKNVELIIDEAGDAIEGLLEIAEASEKRISRLSDRITSLEKELRISKSAIDTAN